MRRTAPERRPLDVAGRDIHLVGIGGCGMSGLARLLASRGGRVGGSESGPSPATGALQAEGFAVEFDQDAGRLPDACDLVVASAAIAPGHPELLEAERRGVPVLTYAEALGASMVGSTGVAVAGTHGKSTTAAMLGSVLVDAGLDPGVIVGATCRQLRDGALPGLGEPSGYRVGAQAIPTGSWSGRPGVLIAEACEFNRSFHHFRPTVASIGSVEADHLDVYGSLDAVVDAFRDFAQLLPEEREGGRLLIAHEGAHRREVTAGVVARVETIGFAPGADWRISTADGRWTLEHAGARVEWTMRVPGEHNAFNAAVAAALAVMLGGDPVVVGRSLSAFAGVDRRTQHLGDKPLPSGGHVRVYDDYGHHPTEVEATLRALRGAERPEAKGGRLICVFQPHQHSRTRFLLDEFARAFDHADVVIVPHIYFVRDSQAEKQKVSAADLVDRLRGQGVRAMHLYPFEAIVEQLENVCRPGDLLVVMGAGPVWQVAHQFMGAGTDPGGGS